MKTAWCRTGEEPALEELLADPMVQLVAQRDGLTAADIWIAAHDAQRLLRSCGGQNSLSGAGENRTRLHEEA